MDLHVTGSTFSLAAKNSREFKRLITKAEKEAQQLRETLRELSCFDFQISFSVEDQAGGIDSASSAISDIPTK